MRLAIIGSYGHVGVVLEGLRQAPGVELAGVARWGADDPMGFLAQADRTPAAPAAVYDDYRAMLATARPDVVAVFTPLCRLAEASLAAVQRGCHVFSEKPLATTLEDLARLRDSASQVGVKVVACMTARGEPAFRTIRRAVREGRIGRCLCAAAQKSYPFATRDEFYRRRDTYGGTIPWQAIHALDSIAYCTGQDYRRVAAVACNLAHPSHPGMEDQGGLLAELTGGGTAVVNFDYLRPWGKARRPWGDDRLRIAGTEGILETKDCASAVELTTPDGAERLPLEPARNVFADFAASLSGTDTGCKQPVPPGEESMPPLITPEESFRITEVALKARQAQDEGRIVQV